MHEAVVLLLRDMVRVDSSNPAMGGPPLGQSRLGEALESVARDMGLSSRRHELAGGLFNLIVWHEVEAARPWLAFDAHLDTVGAAGMTVDPFGAEVRGGRMYGRGACDTKASGAAMLSALGRYARQKGGEGGRNNVVLTFTCDEETVKTGMNALAADDFAARPAGRPAAAVVGEPTGLSVVVAHGGVVRWAIVTQGKSAHSSDPAKGRSAISTMVKVVTAIESEYCGKLDAAHPLVGKACCSINQIAGGRAMNIIPDRCQITLDRRIVPGEDPAGVLPAVERVLEALRAREPGVRVRQMPAFADPALDDASGRSFVQRVRPILRELGRNDAPKGARYCTNASQFGVAGVPAVVLGPGSIEQAHTADEWVELTEVEAATDLYLALMNASLMER